jgi:hypothetical protein
MSRLRRFGPVLCGWLGAEGFAADASACHAPGRFQAASDAGLA